MLERCPFLNKEVVCNDGFGRQIRHWKESTVQRKLLVLATFSLMLLQAKGTFAADYVPGEVLVQLQPGVSISAFDQLYGTQIIAGSPLDPHIAYRRGRKPTSRRLSTRCRQIQTLFRQASTW